MMYAYERMDVCWLTGVSTESNLEEMCVFSLLSQCYIKNIMYVMPWEWQFLH